MRARLQSDEETLGPMFAELVQDAQAAELPPYIASLLAHLRLLVGVPFAYLVPDPRLLPDESIRFFYLDRSWTDRLVDGAIAVGKAGTRELLHHHERHEPLRGALDAEELQVRQRQRGRPDAAQTDAPAERTITGFLLRSALVSRWPHMEVRAFAKELSEAEAQQPELLNRHGLRLLRLERLSPSVLIALFLGVPRLVWLEEPQHCLQFGLEPEQRAQFQRPGAAPGVIDLLKLRDKRVGPPPASESGSAALAERLILKPWRQRFQGVPRLHPFDFDPADPRYGPIGGDPLVDRPPRVDPFWEEGGHHG